MKMNLWKLITKLRCIPRLTLLIVYLLIGAAIFVSLEQTDEPNKVVAGRILSATQTTLSLRLGVNITDEDFLGAIKNISEAVSLRSKQDWTFWKAFDFVFVALTTIGYGDMVPQSQVAQGVFIIYALIGLPIVMVTLKYTGLFMSECLEQLIVGVEKKLFRKEEHKRLYMKCFIASLILFVVEHLVLAYSFSHTHNVPYIRGLYAVFVTLTTIGFGDYKLSFVATELESMHFFIIFKVPLILFNLTIVSCILNRPVELAENIRERIVVKIESVRTKVNPTTEDCNL